MSKTALTSGTTSSRIRYLLSDVVLYGVASILVPLIGLAAVPLLTRVLGQAEYGLFELMLSYVAIASVVAGAGQDHAAARFYYDSPDTQHRRSLITQAFWTQCAMSCLVAVVFVFVLQAPFLAATIEGHRPLVFAAALTVPAMVLFNFSRSMLKWTFMRKEYVYASLGYTLLVVCGYALFVLVLAGGPAGAIASQCAAALLIGAAAVWRLRAAGLGAWAGIRHRTLLRYGMPYVLLGLLTQGVRVADKSFLASTNGLEAAAVYAVGFKLATVLLLVESTFNLAWGPIAFAIHKERTSAETYNVALSLLAWVICAVFAGISLFADVAIALLAPAGYENASAVVALVGFGFVMQSIAGVTAVGVELAKKPWILLLSWGGGMAVTLALLLLLPRPLSVVATAAAVGAGLVTESILRTAGAYAAYPLRLNLWLAAFPVVLAAGLVLLQQELRPVLHEMAAPLLFVVFCLSGAMMLRGVWQTVSSSASA